MKIDSCAIDFSCIESSNDLHAGNRYEFTYNSSIYSVPGLLLWRGNKKKLVVFLPSALPVGKERNIPSFLRWTWAESLGGNVLVVDDPTISLTELYGGWFQGINGVSTFSSILELVKKVMSIADITEHDVVFHGSSLGGFGAIILSTMLPNSYAIAEVPQLDLRNYPVKSAIELLEKESFGRESISCAYLKRPFDISVLEAIKKYVCIPNFIIVTNSDDEAVLEHKKFMNDIYELEKNDYIKHIGARSLCMTKSTRGHSAIGKSHAVFLLNNIHYLLQ